MTDKERFESLTGSEPGRANSKSELKHPMETCGVGVSNSILFLLEKSKKP